ncbi:cyclin-dependent kinase 2-interacting protein [Trichogramma pretiosum]|uniref:cyclin-dependent kinase 2-interacting protein n=1 Tax=Trichogramma pretiosum TaxID=7493 RepID=UPI0006C9C659|nr:cyclin-dependent kinase 2-interacting protein [Trichogramma pretiosum]
MDSKRKCTFTPFSFEDPETPRSPSVLVPESCRSMREHVLGVEKNLQDWQAYHDIGLRLLKIVCNVTDETLPDELLQPCEKLDEVCDKLDAIVTNLKAILNKMKAIAELQKDKGPLFRTWETKRFVEITEEIYESYRKEAEEKRIIHEIAPRQFTRKDRVSNCSMWRVQPLIDLAETNRNVDYMLWEIGEILR